MNTLVKKVSLSVAIISVLVVGFAFAMPTITDHGISVGPLKVLAFGSIGGDDTWDCNCDSEPTPPSYNPPTYNPPTYNPPTYNPPPFCSVFIAPGVVESGGSAVITWFSTNATSATVTSFGSEPVNGSRTLSNITSTKTYTVTVSGPGGSYSCHDTVTVQKTPPYCTIYANPSTIQNGNSSTLNWTSSNATSASLTGSGSVNVNGSKSVSPTNTKTYTLTVTGPGGTANCQTTIIVEQPQTPVCALTINPHNVEYNGSATISWTSQNATNATIDQGIGSVSVNGSQSVYNLTGTKTYKLTVTGPGGTAHCQDTVTVNQQPQAPSCTIYANPSNVQYNGSSTLTWNTSNAVSATINQGIGSVSLNGSQSVYNITNTKTYTMTVYSASGQSANCQTTITTQQQENLWCSISANPSFINNQGGSSYLTWSSNGAVSANLSNVGSVATNGSQTVYPNGTTTYTLTIYGSNNQTATCQTTVNVGSYNNPPSCWITFTPQYNQYNYNNNNYYNNQGTLSWGSTNATSAYINPSIGSVSTYGSRTVYNTNNQVYTMTVYGSNGQQATCQTQSTYVPPPTYYPPQVALTQIPYTGFDFGPVGNTIYWFALIAFALAAGYLAVYYLPMFAGLKARMPEEVIEAPMVFAKSVAATVPFTRTARATANGASFQDSMTFARSEDGAPRIVISRS